jgi:hypothetical protein
MIPPDFTTFWTQAQQQGLKPRIATVGKALLFPASVEALGTGGDKLSTEIWWSPIIPSSHHCPATARRNWLRRNWRITANVVQRDSQTIKPQPRLRMPEFWQQPRRCHVCVQSPVPRSRLQLAVFPISGLNFVAENSSLTISDRRKAGGDARLCSALVSITTREKPAISSSLGISAVS